MVIADSGSFVAGGAMFNSRIFIEAPANDIRVSQRENYRRNNVAIVTYRAENKFSLGGE